MTNYPELTQVTAQLAERARQVHQVPPALRVQHRAGPGREGVPPRRAPHVSRLQLVSLPRAVLPCRPFGGQPEARAEGERAQWPSWGDNRLQVSSLLYPSTHLQVVHPPPIHTGPASLRGCKGIMASSFRISQAWLACQTRAASACHTSQAAVFQTCVASALSAGLPRPRAVTSGGGRVPPKAAPARAAGPQPPQARGPTGGANQRALGWQDMISEAASGLLGQLVIGA
jgi:hypothetical protein